MRNEVDTNAVHASSEIDVEKSLMDADISLHQENIRKGVRYRAGLWKEQGMDYPHFEQIDETEQDRHGNAIFSSKNHSFIDKNGDPIAASLLMSKSGRLLIDKHKDLLRLIESGIYDLQYSFDSTTFKSKKITYLRENIKLTRYAGGGQSQVFLLEIDDEKYLVKIAQTQDKHFGSVTQPYIDEMLQTQNLGEDLKELLENQRIRMAQFMFASSALSCVKFEEGTYPTEEELKCRLTPEFLARIQDYILNGGELWKDISLDVYNFHFNHLRTDNFIELEDGTIVWIDPFSTKPRKIIWQML